MEIIDFNGFGRWSRQDIQERYALYARRFKVSAPLELMPQEHDERGRHWIYPVMFEVIKGIEMGDAACIEIGVECIIENQWVKFGKIIKANTARALRRSTLTEEQSERLRKHIVSMLVEEHIPGHYRSYARLLRKIGVGSWWPFIEEHTNRNNPYVMRFYKYFEEYVRPK